MKLYLVALAGIAELIQVIEVVFLSEEAGIAVVAALDDMAGNTPEIYPGFAGYGKILFTTGCREWSLNG